MKLAEGSAVEHEESLAVVEVQVESSSLEAVCGMHHAVLRRVQVTSALLDLDAVKWKDIKLKTFLWRQAEIIGPNIKCLVNFNVER